MLCLQAKLNLAQDAKRQAAFRAGNARADWQERCRERVREVRDSAAEEARTSADAAVQAELDYLNALRNKANARARGAENREATASELAAKRLKAMHEAESSRDAVVSVNDELYEQLEGSTHQDGVNALAKLAQIPKLGTVAVHREGNGSAHGWDLGMRGTVIELLLNGTPTHAIPGNILTFVSYLLPFVKEPHVPQIRFCQRMRSELRVGTETSAAYLIGKALNWRQLFTDGTGRRQIHLLNVIIGIDGPDGDLVPMVLRAAMIGTGESAEQQVEDILEMAIKRGGAKLQRLREVFEELYPGVEHDIPDIGDMNIAKFAGGMITSDNCNGALKVKRCMVAAVQDAIKHEYTAEEWDTFTDKEQAAKLLVLEGDCWNHLRNVWFGRATNSITNSLKVKLKDDLDQIDFRLRVVPDMALVLRASDKEFSLCANYPKGHGDMFREWVMRTHPRVLLFHVVSTDGGRL